jgi:hypothetical protein
MGGIRHWQSKPPKLRVLKTHVLHAGCAASDDATGAVGAGSS